VSVVNPYAVFRQEVGELLGGRREQGCHAVFQPDSRRFTRRIDALRHPHARRFFDRDERGKKGGLLHGDFFVRDFLA